VLHAKYKANKQKPRHIIAYTCTSSAHSTFSWLPVVRARTLLFHASIRLDAHYMHQFLDGIGRFGELFALIGVQLDLNDFLQAL
jgi:hypothetical protein